MVYLIGNTFSTDTMHGHFFNDGELSYVSFAGLFINVWRTPYNSFVRYISNDKRINGKLRKIWNKKVELLNEWYCFVSSKLKFNTLPYK